MVYQDVGNSNKATVKKCTANEWEVVGSAGFSAGPADYTTIAVNGSGTPYVVFRDKSTGVPGADYLKATVMKYGSSGWEVVGSSHFSAGSAIYTSIAIAPDETPYVVYQDNGNSNQATVMKFDGSNWVNVGSPGFSGSYWQLKTYLLLDDPESSFAFFATA